MVSKGSWVKCL